MEEPRDPCVAHCPGLPEKPDDARQGKTTCFVWTCRGPRDGTRVFFGVRWVNGFPTRYTPLRRRSPTPLHYPLVAPRSARRRRELPCVPMLLPCAALRQPSKSAALAASDSLLPRMGCSLRSGCAMDESHGVGTQSSTLRGRGRAGKLTQVSFAVAQHGAAAPAFVRAHS